MNCASFPNNTINQFVNDDVIANGQGCTIGRMASINGGVFQTGDGGLVIRGTVNGGVSEAGPGDVVIARGARVSGDVAEADQGNLALRGGSSIDGAIQESGDGSVTVTVDVPGLVKGNITELSIGAVTTRGAGLFKGNSEHQLPGTCANTSLRFEGAVCNLL